MARLKRIQQAGGDDAAAAAARVAPATAAPAASEAAKPAEDLDNPATQERILEPAVVTITACGEPVLLHQLPARLQRQLTGVFGQLVATIAGKPGPFTVRLQGALAASPELSAQFFSLLARATYPADFPIDQEVAQRITLETARFDAGVKYHELALLFDRMATLNGVMEAFSGPK